MRASPVDSASRLAGSQMREKSHGITCVQRSDEKTVKGSRTEEAQIGRLQLSTPADLTYTSAARQYESSIIIHGTHVNSPGTRVVSAQRSHMQPPDHHSDSRDESGPTTATARITLRLAGSVRETTNCIRPTMADAAVLRQRGNDMTHHLPRMSSNLARPRRPHGLLIRPHDIIDL